MDHLHEYDSVVDQAQHVQDYFIQHLNSAQYYDHFYDL